jgi:hypothetical protein
LKLKQLKDMKAKIMLAGLAFFAFTTIGVAQGTAKKADCPAKTECGSGKAECGAAKTECTTAKADKAPAAKTATTSKKAVAKPAAKK